MRELIGHGQYAKLLEAIMQPGSNDIIAHLSFGQMSPRSVCSSMGRVKSLQGFEVGWASVSTSALGCAIRWWGIRPTSEVSALEMF